MNEKKTLRRRVPAALLALIMVLSLMPTAFAATVDMNSPCTSPTSINRVHSWQWEEVRAATCHDKGMRKGTCTFCTNVCYDEPSVNPNNHDYLYTDNGNGTHRAECRYHPEAIVTSQPHGQLVNGRCPQCLAVDYEAVTIVLPKDPVFMVSLDTADYGLSLGEVSLTLGSADVTKEYSLTYSWYYQGSLVYTGDTYTLPTSITSKEGDYKYVCFVMAVPKSSQTTQPISASCTVTVRVKDLISAHATLGRGDKSLYLGLVDSWSAQSVVEQIYQAVYNSASNNTAAYPSHVIFGTKPSSKVGDLLISGTKTPYYFNPTNNSQTPLADVRFQPSGEATGNYVISFTAYDTRGKEYPGSLTITVQQYTGDMDVMYTTSKDAPVTMAASDFETFWQDIYPRGGLTWVRFSALPSSYDGNLYTDFTSVSRPGTRVKAGDTFYVQPGNGQYGINEVTFLPGVRQADFVTVPFDAYGTNNLGQPIHQAGTLYIFISSGKVADITWRVTAGGSYALDAEEFLKVYQSATGSKGNNFYIQLLELPASGSLYVNYRNSTSTGTRLTAASIDARPFYYSSSRGELISGLTYVPGTAQTDSFRYVAYDGQGKLLYVGNVVCNMTDLTVSYNSTSDGVSFRARDFAGLLGTTGRLNTVSFTPPAAVYGTLYYNRSLTSPALTPGTAITSDSVWYSVSDKATAATALTMDNVSFVPAANYSGTVTIPFAAYDEQGSKLSGTVKISVTATTPKPSVPNNPGTTVPTVTFKDVPKTTGTAWYYDAVVALASAGILGGFEDGTFRPDGEVTYGQALKMIMMAAGYPEQAATTKHWASGYVAKAMSDGLLSQSVDPDRKINRYAIAEIAAKALRLPTSTQTTSPFHDMAMTVSSAPYVLSLYDAKIVAGSTNNKGQVMYYGVNSIRRSEMAVIIQRMYDYAAKTAN